MSKFVLVVALPGFVPAPNQVRLTQKFVEGVCHYVKHWPGQVQVLMPRGEMASGNLDDVVVERSQLPFSVEIVDFNSDEFLSHMDSASVVLSVPDGQLSRLARYCHQRSIPYVLNMEYSFKTRLQIALEEEAELLSRCKRLLWESMNELRVRSQVHHSSSLQCNGTPTYRQYGRQHPDALLYFDSRITPDALVSQATIADKYASWSNARPLHLAFSGRLIKMKGADYLIPVALELQRLGVNFRFSILGGGDLEETLRSEVARHGLLDCVTIAGVLDFKTEWLSFVSRQVDLFVCCHPQGDPSCTYIETFACGVPIVGFANEAFTGLCELTQAGWHVPIGDTLGLAQHVARVAREPQVLHQAALKARDFAANHTFDQTFRARIDHLLRLSREHHLNSANAAH